MANPKHLELLTAVLQSGLVRRWNDWRGARHRIDPVHGYMSLVDVDLTEADLQGLWSFSHLDLADVNFARARLDGTLMHSANLRRANLREARLTRTDLRRAVLDGADLSGADLSHASLCGATLSDTNLAGARLHGADLSGARLIRANLQGADLRGCLIYGISSWDVKLEGARQQDLLITQQGQPPVVVDSLEVAQFLYLLLNNDSLRKVIETITAKAVLILGRFRDERKAVLDCIRDALRERGYLPMMFDFERPQGRTYGETVSTLAHMARFVIADVTDARVVLQELDRLLAQLPSVPVRAIVKAASDVNPVVLDFVGRLNFLSELHPYQDVGDLVSSLKDKVIAPAEARLAAIELEREKFRARLRQLTTASATP